MKIVIDIPERLKEIADGYSKIDNEELDGLTYFRMNGRLALFCISKGTSLPEHLNKIKDEIDLKQYSFMGNSHYEEGIRFGLMMAYQIIDKYKAESEDDK